MEQKNEVVVSKDFNKAFTAFKNAISKTNENMGKASLSAYICANENKKEFTKRCKETFPELAQSTVSKMVQAGQIIALGNTLELELPTSYSKVYELAPVKEQLESFYSFVEEDSEKEVQDMTQKELRDEVDKFITLAEPTEDDVVDVEADIVEADEEVDEVEEGDDTLANNFRCVVNVLNELINNIENKTKKDIGLELVDIVDDLNNLIQFI